jgi:hypothetical protein
MIVELRHPNDHEARACSAMHPNRSRPDPAARLRNLTKPYSWRSGGSTQIESVMSGRSRRVVIPAVRRPHAVCAGGGLTPAEQVKREAVRLEAAK